MREKLFTIDAALKIAGRGIIVVGELEANARSCKTGSNVWLVRPDGNELVTEVSGIERVKPLNYENFNWNQVGIMLKDVVRKEDVPVGTEVYLET